MCENADFSRANKRYTHQELASLYRLLLQRPSVDELVARLHRPLGCIARKFSALAHDDPITWRPYLFQPYAHLHHAMLYRNGQNMKDDATKKQDREHERAYYRANREKILRARCRYYQRNRAKEIAYMARYRAAHREQIRANGRAFYARNKAKVMAHNKFIKRVRPYRQFGAFLSARLNEQKMTKKEAAASLGIPYSTIRDYTKGIYRPSQERVGKWAALLTTSTTKLELLLEHHL